MKKKVFSLLLTATIITCSCVYPVCASEEAADGVNGIETSDYYRLGDSISTDIMDFTLDSARFAIALENTYGDDYILPKEYDASDDANNPFVASIGHTLVYFSMIITNNNRTSLNINDTFSDWVSSFVSVIYDDEYYNAATGSSLNIRAVSDDGIEWENYTSLNIILNASETKYIRCYMDIPVGIDDLTETFDVQVGLLRSDESIDYQLYHVTEEDIESQANREISLETAIARFYEPEGKEYFENHKDEFPVVDISEVAEIITKDIKWTTYMYQYKAIGGSWEGWFAFNDDGSIEETYVVNGQYNTGYFANRRWVIEGDQIIISYSSSQNSDSYPSDMRKVADNVYLFVCEDTPWLLIQMNGAL